MSCYVNCVRHPPAAHWAHNPACFHCGVGFGVNAVQRLWKRVGQGLNGGLPRDAGEGMDCGDRMGEGSGTKH